MAIAPPPDKTSSCEYGVGGELRRRPFDIVTACRSADLRILRLTLAGLQKFIPFKQLHVLTAGRNFKKFRRALGSEVQLLEENDMIPGVRLEELRRLPLPGFPKGAGWYFQQLLKFAYAFQIPDDDYYLIWDADTIPLQQMEFFDPAGRMLFTTGVEDHPPYFENYRYLLKEEPNHEWSFISQHIPVQKSILRELLAVIETNFPGEQNWAWGIMRNLRGRSTNLFSEYETLGHYVKSHYPERAAYRELPWLRAGAQTVGGVPSAGQLTELSKSYCFAAFESGQMPIRRAVRRLREFFGRY